MEENKRQQRLGRQLIDVTSYITPETGKRAYAALWQVPRDTAIETRFYVDQPVSTHERLQESWAKQKVRTQRLSMRMHNLTTPLFTAIGVAGKADEDVFHITRLQRDFGDILPGSLQLDCQAMSIASNKRDCFEANEESRSLREGFDLSNASPSDIYFLAKSELRCGHIAEAAELLKPLFEKSKNVGVGELYATALARLGNLEQFSVEIKRLEKVAKGADRWKLELLHLREAILREDEIEATTRLANLETAMHADDKSKKNPLLRFAVARGNALVAGMDDWGIAEKSRSFCITILNSMAGDSQLKPKYLLAETDFDGLRDSPEFGKLLRRIGWNARYCGVWSESKDLESRQLFEKTPEEHSSLASKLLEQGYFPTCVTCLPSSANQQRTITSVWHRTVKSEQAFRKQAAQRAKLYIALARLGESDELLLALGDTHGIDTRVQAIELISQLGLSPTVILEQYRPWEELSATQRRSLLLAIGGYVKQGLSKADLSILTQILKRGQESDDSAEASAARWCSTRWGLGPKEIDSKPKMIPLRPRTPFRMGSPSYEQDRGSSETQYFMKIPRSYALAATETTQTQFQRFLDSPRGHAAYKDRPFRFSKEYAPSESGPQISTRWFDAARYCQWLSEQEGLPEDEWCFPGIWEMSEDTFTLPKDVLSRKGYRLPTEAEWEYACRAGAESPYFFGNDSSLLSQYAWFDGNSDGQGHPVASLKPNDFGFFDMCGSVNEWCLNESAPYKTPVDDAFREDDKIDLTIDVSEARAARGGYFRSPPAELRSADRTGSTPNFHRFSIGFRVARTVD